MCCPVALLRLPGLQLCERRPRKAKPPPGNTLLHSRHIIRIHILTVAQRVTPAGAFDLKAVLLIHRNRRGIIGEHRQLNTLDAQPVVAHINHGTHQRAGDAAVVPARIHADTKIGDVATAGALDGGKALMADDLLIDTGHQLLHAGRIG